MFYLKYGLHAERITRCANIFLEPTLSTTSQSSRWRRSTFSSVRVARGCFSEVWLRRAGEGARSTTISPILCEDGAPPVALPEAPLDPPCWGRDGGDAQPHLDSICNTIHQPPRRLSNVLVLGPQSSPIPIIKTFTFYLFVRFPNFSVKIGSYDKVFYVKVRPHDA